MSSDWLKTQPALAFTGLLFAFSLLITIPAFALEDRVFQGVNVWLKTIKFQAALAIYLLSLVFFASWAPSRLLNSARFKLYVTIVCLMCWAEILWIAGASTYATASHYNDDNLVMQVIYPIMGVFAVTLTTVSFVVGRAILRNPETGLDPALQLSIGLALMITCVLTIIAAGTLSSQPSHFIGVPQTGATVPLMGWSREVGDLRVAHFMATHAMHILPLVGLLSLALPSMRARKTVVKLASVAFCGFVAFVFVQALLGRPFISI